MVEREHQILSRLAGDRSKLAHDPSMGVDLVADAARTPPQLAVEALLDTGLANAESRNAHDRILVDLALAGHADITNHMDRAAGITVVAVGCPVCPHARKLRGEDIEQAELLPGEPFGHENGEVAALAPGRPHDAVPIGGRNGDDA